MLAKPRPGTGVRSLGEYRLALKVAEFVLRSGEALLGIKEQALTGALQLLNEY